MQAHGPSARRPSPTGRASTALWLALAVITLSTHVAADGSGGFKTARATWYEDNGQVGAACAEAVPPP